jgi:hypothetical protein
MHHVVLTAITWGSKECKEELFRALNTILDVVTTLNLKDLEARAAAAVAAD